jgi:endonuclease YncB( thermonuclease family)
MDAMNALRITAIALLIILAPAAYSDQLTGKVVGISDGDTITILTEQNQNIKIRLAEIDAP